MSEALRADLCRLLGTEALLPESENPAYAEDVYAVAKPPAAVIRPKTAAALPDLVRYAAERGIGLIPRGGGLSYSDAYLCREGRFLVLDLSALGRVLEIATEDAYVRVECGCTWAALARALKERGLRTPYWGPLSGGQATVGGALSQNSVFLGSASFGPVGESVLSLTLLDGCGRLFATGAAAAGSAPFFRHFGPDFTGCFLGDAGTLGIKLEASLRLLPRLGGIAFLSFQFATAESFLAAFSELARARLCAELYGFDPILAAVRLKRLRLAESLAAAGRVLARQGLFSFLRLARGGRRFLDPRAFSLHAVIEGETPAVAKEKLRLARAMLSRAGGREIEASIPRVLRSDPFPPPDVILGPDGERWVPVHGILPHSRAAAAFEALQAALAAEAEASSRHGVKTGFLFVAAGPEGALIEPCFYWPGEWRFFHRRRVRPEVLARLRPPPPDPEAEALVARLRRRLADLLRAHGAAHFQLGRFYRWRGELDPVSRALYAGLKRELDPAGILNPGALPEEIPC
jgi:FAD/FMN-containing dehydrogenase